MGQTSSQDDVQFKYDPNLLQLHIMNCSSKMFWLKSEDGWEEVTPNNQLRSYRVKRRTEIFIYNEDRSNIVTSVCMLDKDMFLYMKHEGVHVMKWPIHSDYKRPFYLMAYADHQDHVKKAVRNGINSLAVNVVFDDDSKTWYVGNEEHKITKVTDWFLYVKTEKEIQAVIVHSMNSMINWMSVPGWKIDLLLDQIRQTGYRRPLIITMKGEDMSYSELEAKLKPREGVSDVQIPVLYQNLPEGNLWCGRNFADPEVVILRNNGKKIKKVYGWATSEQSFCNFLKADFDGVIVGHEFVKKAKGLIRKNPFYRMADHRDEAFALSSMGCSSLVEEPDQHQQSKIDQVKKKPKKRKTKRRKNQSRD